MDVFKYISRWAIITLTNINRMKVIDNYKRSESERGEDLLLTIDLREKGFTFRQIAEHISNIRTYSITHIQVFNSYNSAVKVKDEDLAKEHREKGIRLMNLIQDEALDSWEKSKGTIKETTKKGILNKGKTGGESGSNLERQEQTVKESESAGNPAYLATIIKAEERKSKFLGIDAPTKLANTDKDGNDKEGVFIIGGKEVKF